MPQLRLDCSREIASQLDTNSLFADLHAIVVELGKGALLDCKSRVAVIEGLYIGDGAPQEDWVHLEIRLLSRPPEVMAEIGRRAQEVLSRAARPFMGSKRMQVTVECVEMQRPLFFKTIYRNGVAEPK